MDKHRLFVIATGVLGVGILLVGFLVGVQPQLDRAGRAAEQTASVEQMNDVQATRNAALAAEHEKLDEYRDELARDRAQIPEARNQSEHIDQLHAAALATGVVLSTVTFDAPKAFEAPAGVALDGPSTSTLVAVGLRLTAEGERGALEAFVRSLQTSPRIVSIDTTEYKGPESATLNIDATTWVLLDDTL